MRSLERLGEFVLNNLALISIFFLVSFWGLSYYNSPQTVTLDAKNWKCTMAVPDGLNTKCMEYVSKEVIK